MWHTYEMPDGDIELADYPARVLEKWCNVVWVITPHCNLGCSYCIGFRHRGTPKSLLQNHSVSAIVKAFEKIRSDSGLSLYITLTGGEPTIIPEFPELCKRLTEAGFVIELQTNLLTNRIVPWLDAVKKENVAHVVSSYHGWALDNNEKQYAHYMQNLTEVHNREILVTCKTIVLPDEVPSLPAKIKRLNDSVPSDSPVMSWPFIRGIPKSPEDFAGAYPYSYTTDEKKAIFDSTPYRKNCKWLYMNGAGFYKGMLCDAGRGFIVLDWKGGAGSCYSLKGEGAPFGNLMAGTIKLNEKPQKCPVTFCGTSFWGMWYGVDPWNYVPGASQEAATYCRFGPKTIKD